MVDYFDFFVSIERALHTWNKSHLVMLHTSFCILLDLVCWYYVENFCIKVFERYCSVVFVIVILYFMLSLVLLSG